MWDHPADVERDRALFSSPALDRPVVVAGAPGVGLSGIASAVGSLSGWPLVELDRRVEHDAGRSVAHIVLDEGAAMLAARCRAHLARALRERPPGIVAVRAAVLDHADTRRELAARARLVLLEAPVDVLVFGLALLRARSPGSVPDFVGGGPLAPAELAAHAAVVDGLQGLAELRVTVDGRSPLRAARAVLAGLGPGGRG